MKASKFKFAIFVYLVAMVSVHAVIFWNMRDLVRKGYSDFAIYYSAGSIVRQGLGRQLYDDRLQFKIQKEVSPGVAIRLGALPYNHPPFEAVILSPLTYLPYPMAFALWDCVNLAMLVALPFLLRPHLPQLQNYSWLLWVLASLSFFPVFLNLLQGQDAILLLFLYTLAFVSLKKNCDLLAGGWLAFALFKPHLVLPFIFFLLMQGRKKVLYGFVPIAGLVASLSLAVVGRVEVAAYPHYVLRLESTLAHGALIPVEMPNLRGALNLLFDGAPYLVPLVLAISLGLLVFTASQCSRGGKKNLFDLKFSLAAIATVLISYHAMVYDLSMLLLPVMLVANEFFGEGRFADWRSAFIVISVVLFAFEPLQLLLSMRYNCAALLCWLLLLWLAGVAGQISFRTRLESSSGVHAQPG